MRQGQGRSFHDFVVVLPGILGSTLARDGKLVWAPSAGSVLTTIWTLGAHINDLKLPADIGDDSPNDRVWPVAVMPDLHVLPGIWTFNIGYGKLLEELQTRIGLIAPSTDPSRPSNLLPVAYDWRLSNRHNGKLLKVIVEKALARWRSKGGPYSEAKLIFICHSMGGLVARWYIEKEGGAALTRKLITLGTPYRGALEALEQLVNGVRKSIGPLKLDFTDFGRSLPSLYQLLPEYACIESSGKELSKTTEIAVPVLNKRMKLDAMEFHDEINTAAALNKDHAYDVHPLVGFRQPTWTTAKIVDESIEPLDTIEGSDDPGDGTVPRLSAQPAGVRPDSPSVHPIPDQHGSLQSNAAVLDLIEGILTASPIIYRAALVPIGVRTERIVLAGEPVVVEATVDDKISPRPALLARVYDERGIEVDRTPLAWSGGRYHGEIGPLDPGAHRVVVGNVDPFSPSVEAVSSTVLVWESGA